MTSRVPTLGIVGAGQLASMLTEAANRIGIDVHAYRSSASNDRCSANAVTTAPFDDDEALAAFAATVDAVTIETEDIPVETLQALEKHVPVYPASSVVAISQDRLFEKRFMADNGVGTAWFAPIDSAVDLQAALDECGGQGILKTRRFGYDGKGQTRIAVGDDAASAWAEHGDAPSILEAFVPFDFEVSVIAARTPGGDIATYDLGRNDHRDGILRTTVVPVQLDAELEAKAVDISTRILNGLDYVGVMGIELFVVGQDLLVNEIAPRVHNSGHWTQEGCLVDQFEQHVRAVMGRPLGSTTRHSNVVMTNIIGNDLDELDSLIAESQSRIHLYGKREVRPGRKMGHTNRVEPLG